MIKRASSSGKKIIAAVCVVAFCLFLSERAFPKSSVNVSGSTCQTVVTCSCNNTCICDSPGTASQICNDFKSDFYDALKSSARDLEEYIFQKASEETGYIYGKLDDLENRLIAKWQEMWKTNQDYSIDRSFKDMAGQLSVAGSGQTFSTGAGSDAKSQVETQQVMREKGLEDHRDFRPSELSCAAATTSGGMGRSAAFSRGMRNAWASDGLAPGYNKRGARGATASADEDKLREEEYEDTFCNPAGNGGKNECGGSADPAYYDADTQPTKYIYNQLTIDVTKTDAAGRPIMEKIVETIINNMVGTPAADPISEGALQSAGGQETFLNRRSYLARYAAVRSVPQLVSGWRMPGSKIGTWVTQMRKDAGVHDNRISDNPSYREVMHAMIVDRPNSGTYGLKLMGEVNGVEMEKLTLNSLYLMELRDYYELLEKTALTLAVQVSILADQAPMPDAMTGAPVK